MANKKKRRSSGGLNTSYLTKMGVHNLIANRSMSFSSISVLTACLLLIGISFTLLINFASLAKDIEKQNVVIAFVKDGADQETITQVELDLRAIPDVLDVEFVSKEVAYEEQLKDFGVEKDLFDGVIENPLPDSFKISVGNLEEFNATLQLIENVKNVQAVRESQELVNQISTMQAAITALCVFFVVVLVLVSMLIISNTIKITMVSRKIDIQVMKSVGATNLFICWPFMIEGNFIGLISGVIALAFTLAVQQLAGNAMSSLLSMFGSEVVDITAYLPALVVCYLASGVLIGSFGSVISIRKYLNKEGSEANEI